MKKLPEEKAREIRVNPPSNLNLAEAAAYVGVCPRKLWDEVSRRRVRCARVGNRLIFQKSELDRWLSVLAAASV